MEKTIWQRKVCEPSALSFHAAFIFKPRPRPGRFSRYLCARVLSAAVWRKSRQHEAADSVCTRCHFNRCGVRLKIPISISSPAQPDKRKTAWVRMLTCILLTFGALCYTDCSVALLGVISFIIAIETKEKFYCYSCYSGNCWEWCTWDRINAWKSLKVFIFKQKKNYHSLMQNMWIGSVKIRFKWFFWYICGFSFSAQTFVLCRRSKEPTRSTLPTASSGIAAKYAANQRKSTQISLKQSLLTLSVIGLFT